MPSTMDRTRGEERAIQRGIRLQGDDVALVYALAAELTGTCQDGRFRHDILVTNVERRVVAVGARSLQEYLEFVQQNEAEVPQLISALTIHTTSWFREAPHFAKVQELLKPRLTSPQEKPFRILCAACSSGEEVYSFALLLEDIRSRNPLFDYRITGIDIDPVCIENARRAVYRREALQAIPQHLRRHLLRGSGETAGLFAVGKALRERVRFEVQNLKAVSLDEAGFDLVVCRNVLIYFSPAEVEAIVVRLVQLLAPNGVLCLGHSESVDSKTHRLERLGNSMYRQMPKGGGSAQSSVLVIDDSATMRRKLQALFQMGGLDVHTVSSAEEATSFLEKRSVDVVTLDLHMPGTSGQVWLRARRQAGLRVPVVIVSGASANEATEVLGALQSGAQDYVDKAKLGSSDNDVVERVKEIAQSHRSRQTMLRGRRNKRSPPQVLSLPDVILVGASTGGTEALIRLLSEAPSGLPPVVVTQHISRDFAVPFARRLAEHAGLELFDPEESPILQKGGLYIPLGDYHVELVGEAGRLRIQPSFGAPVNRHRPSVDVMFRSAVKIRRRSIWAILLTGMGADGAQGLDELKRAGAMTFAQDEESCVVFGMPKEAIRLGAAQFVGSPQEIRAEIDRVLRSQSLFAPVGASSSSGEPSAL